MRMFSITVCEQIQRNVRQAGNGKADERAFLLDRSAVVKTSIHIVVPTTNRKIYYLGLERQCYTYIKCYISDTCADSENTVYSFEFAQSYFCPSSI